MGGGAGEGSEIKSRHKSKSATCHFVLIFISLLKFRLLLKDFDTQLCLSSGWTKGDISTPTVRGIGYCSI